MTGLKKKKDSISLNELEQQGKNKKATRFLIWDCAYGFN